MWTVASRALILVITLVTVAALSRLVDADEFGLVAIAFAFSTFLTSVVYFGLPVAAAQADTVSAEAHSALFFVNLSIGIVLSFVLFLSAGPAAAFYDDPALTNIFRWCALVPLLAGLQAQHRLLLMRQLRFAGIAVIDVLAQLCSAIVAIALAQAGHGISALVANMCVVFVVQTVLLLGLTRWVPSRPGRWRSEVVPILRVGSHVFGANLMRNLSRTALVPVMGASLPASSIGSFDRGQQLAVVPVRTAVDQMQRVAVPVLSRLKKRPDRMASAVRDLHLIVMYGIGVSFAILAGASAPAVRVVLGPGWTTAAKCFAALGAAASFRSMGQVLQWYYVSSDRSRVALKLSLWTQPLVVAVSLAGLPLGVVGVAVFNSVGWLLYWLVLVVRSFSDTPYERRALLVDSIRVLAFVAVPAGLASALLATLFEDPSAALVASLTAGCAVAATATLAIPACRRDLHNLLSVVKRVSD